MIDLKSTIQDMPSNLERLMFLRVTRDETTIRLFSEDIFEDERLRKCFKSISLYAERYKDMPDPKKLSGIVNTLQTKGILGIESESKEDITDPFVDLLYEDSFKKSAEQEENKWLDEQIDERVKKVTIEKALLSATSAFRDGMYKHKDPVAVVGDIQDKLREATLPVMAKADIGLDFYNPEHHKQDELERTSTGITFLDKCSNGGYWKGSLWCVMGAPKSGKTYTMHNLLASAVRAGVDTCLVSLELARTMCMSRIGSNLLSINISQYQSAEESGVVGFKLKAMQASNFRNGRLVVQDFPTSKLSVSELASYLISTERSLSKPGKPFKFKVIFLDYINLMSDEKGSKNDNSYTKIKNIAEGLRRIAKENDWCIVTATQTTRSQTDTEEISATDVSESSALNATLDMMFGIIKSPAMDANNEMFLKCLLSRAGGMNTKQRFILEKDYMRATEDLSPGGYFDPSEGEKQRSFYNNEASSNGPQRNLQGQSAGNFYGHQNKGDFFKKLEEVAGSSLSEYNDPKTMQKFGVTGAPNDAPRQQPNLISHTTSEPMFIDSDDAPPAQPAQPAQVVVEEQVDNRQRIQPMGMGSATPPPRMTDFAPSGGRASDDPLSPNYAGGFEALGDPLEALDRGLGIQPIGMGASQPTQPPIEVAPTPPSPTPTPPATTPPAPAPAPQEPPTPKYTAKPKYTASKPSKLEYPKVEPAQQAPQVEEKAPIYNNVEEEKAGYDMMLSAVHMVQQTLGAKLEKPLPTFEEFKKNNEGS